MKTKQELLKQLYATLVELEQSNPNEIVKNRLKIELQLLYNILGEDVAEEYWESIEEIIEG